MVNIYNLVNYKFGHKNFKNPYPISYHPRLIPQLISGLQSVYCIRDHCVTKAIEWNLSSNNWPAPSSIQRGLEWTQLLKRLIVCLSVL